MSHTDVHVKTGGKREEVAGSKKERRRPGETAYGQWQRRRRPGCQELRRQMPGECGEEGGREEMRGAGRSTVRETPQAAAQVTSTRLGHPGNDWRPHRGLQLVPLPSPITILPSVHGGITEPPKDCLPNHPPAPSVPHRDLPVVVLQESAKRPVGPWAANVRSSWPRAA